MPRNRNNYERQRPADQVSQDVRDAWRELKFHEFMDKLREKATGCVVRVCSMKNRHIKITGPNVEDLFLVSPRDKLGATWGRIKQAHSF